jgi:site-specific recombinase XerD
MESSLVIVPENEGIALVGRAKEYMADSVADNTKRGYASDFRQFSAWCEAAGVQALPSVPSTVAAYFSAMADIGRKASTIDRARAAIRMAHETAGFADPTNDRHVRLALKGIRRTIGTAKAKTSPTLSNDIKAMIAALPSGKIGLRDRALLLVGFAGAFRRSELAGVSLEHIEETSEGIKILLLKSKTDQEGQGRYVGIKRGENPATCPIRALKAWIEVAGITSGPIFRSVDRHGNIKEAITPQTVALVVKRTAEAAGLDPAKYSGHSLRAGFVTQGAIGGASETNIMRQTGHKSHDTVRGYIRIANIFKDNVSGMLGL